MNVFAGKTHGAKQGSLYTSSCPDRRASGVIRASLTALARDGRIKSGHDACNNRHHRPRTCSGDQPGDLQPVRNEMAGSSPAMTVEGKEEAIAAARSPLRTPVNNDEWK
ncbi:MAG TPA: hypothetical protein VH933_07740 [Aestuariivirgaceae bacterium]